MPQYAQRKGVYQRVAFVALVEIHLAGHGRNAEAISVMRNAADHASEEPSHLAIIQLAKAQGVDRAHRARAHGENIADNPAHTCGRPLEWLHRAGMIMALDLERNRQIIANIENARIFLAGSYQHAGGFHRKPLEQRTCVFVRAMLAPHHTENAQLREIRFATDDLLNALVFLRRKTVFGDQLRRDGRVSRH